MDCGIFACMANDNICNKNGIKTELKIRCITLGWNKNCEWNSMSEC